MKSTILIFALAFAIAPARGQDAQPDRVSVPFSDASRPRLLKASLLNGGITVKGYDGQEAIVEARSRSGEGRHRKRDEHVPEGMRRIDINGSGLHVEESGNVVTVGTGWRNQNVDLMIQAPYNTSLKLSAVNGGDIVVERVSGDVEINNTNGNATAQHISGSAIVHALNGKVLVSLDKAAPDKPMSFSSLNGDIDVTLPADVRANVKMKSDNGEVYSDFDVKVDASSRQPAMEDNRSGKGKYRVRFDRATHGSINGGGPEMQFTTFNGNIYIRKAK